MAQHYPNLVGSLVVSGSVAALSESISSGCLERIGFASWTDFLMPDSAQGAKVLLDVGSYDLPWMPDFFYKHYCQIMFSNRKERVELLDALVVKDEDAYNHQFQQLSVDEAYKMIEEVAKHYAYGGDKRQGQPKKGGKHDLEAIDLIASKVDMLARKLDQVNNVPGSSSPQVMSCETCGGNDHLASYCNTTTEHVASL
uniref:Uncharacterized protein n=1 Tax=Chenopodium quinoa TaxID=63459 RepID=A0A803M2Z0_CHEQI